MVTDWYQKTLGTEFEGSNYPSLYHKYVGHDNNRDAFQTNMIESQYMAKILFRDWVPQAYVDHHHMGSYGARIFLPPYAEPVRPSADPLVWREIAWWGAQMGNRLEAAGKTGVIGNAIARPNGIAVARRAPHPHAAVLFYDFELSPEGQQIIANLEFVPTSKKIDTPLNRMPMKFVDAKVAIDEYDKWKTLYGQLFGRGR